MDARCLVWVGFSSINNNILVVDFSFQAKVWFHYYMCKNIICFSWEKVHYIVTCKQTFQKYKDNKEHLKKLADEVNLLKSFSRDVNFQNKELVIFSEFGKAKKVAKLMTGQ